MPTVTESKTNEANNSLPVTPTPAEPELFAAEIAMEQRSSNLLPLILILGLILVVGGTVFYFVKGARDVLTTETATSALTQVLQSQAAPTVHFSTGTVVESVNEKPLDPHYKLLAKASVVTTKPKGPTSLIVDLTGPGETLITGITGVKKNKNADGTTTYEVPLAARKLISIDKVTMLKPHLAKVDYTWQWQPNRLGQQFDASGSLVKSFTTWDRATLIKSYGVDFYSAPPARAAVVLMEGDNGSWRPYTE